MGTLLVYTGLIYKFAYTCFCNERLKIVAILLSLYYIHSVLYLQEADILVPALSRMSFILDTIISPDANNHYHILG